MRARREVAWARRLRAFRWLAQADSPCGLDSDLSLAESFNCAPWGTGDGSFNLGWHPKPECQTARERPVGLRLHEGFLRRHITERVTHHRGQRIGWAVEAKTGF